MNPARWVMADQMLREKERRWVRRVARILGTDLDLAKDDIPDEVEFGKAPQIMPLAGLLNPEVFSKFIQTETSGEESGIEDSEYERQIAEMEKNGMLTDLDMLGSEVDEKLKSKRKRDQWD